MAKDEAKLTGFISYAVEDRGIASALGDALEERGVNAWYDVMVPVGDSLEAEIYNLISASDYLIVLLSPHTLSSKWTSYELSTAIGKELTIRGITILPVLIADTEIPDVLRQYQLIDCRGDVKSGIEKLVEQISTAPEIDFSRLDWKSFQDLVVDLMSKLGFRHIENPSIINNREIDIKAEYLHPDPFDVIKKEIWIGECKFYRKSRVDLGVISDFFSKLSQFPNAHGFLVTSSQLTSVAKNFLEDMKVRNNRDVRIIDGTELKRLLIKNKDIATKYFSESK